MYHTVYMLAISLIAYMQQRTGQLFWVTLSHKQIAPVKVFIESTNESNKGTHLITADTHKFECSSASVNAFYMYCRSEHFRHEKISATKKFPPITFNNKDQNNKLFSSTYKEIKFILLSGHSDENKPRQKF